MFLADVDVDVEFQPAGLAFKLLVDGFDNNIGGFQIQNPLLFKELLKTSLTSPLSGVKFPRRGCGVDDMVISHTHTRTRTCKYMHARVRAHTHTFRLTRGGPYLRGVIGSTVGAYPRGTGSNPVEGNGHFFPSYRQLYLLSFSDTHTHTHTHTHTCMHTHNTLRFTGFIIYLPMINLYDRKEPSLPSPSPPLSLPLLPSPPVPSNLSYRVNSFLHFTQKACLVAKSIGSLHASATTQGSFSQNNRAWISARSASKFSLSSLIPDWLIFFFLVNSPWIR